MRKTSRILVALITVLVLGLAATGCSCSTSNTSNSNSTTNTTNATAQKHYEFKVSANTGDKIINDIDTGDTTASTLRELMDQMVKEGVLTYEMGTGTSADMVITINGIRADYNQDHAYWAIYVNGQYGQLGVNQQPVSNNDSFEFRYEKAQ